MDGKETIITLATGALLATSVIHENGNSASMQVTISKQSYEMYDSHTHHEIEIPMRINKMQSIYGITKIEPIDMSKYPMSPIFVTFL